MTAPTHRYRCGLWLILAGAALAGGCSPTVDLRGNMPDPAVVEEIAPGRTNRDAVARALGTPSTVATFDQDTWYYIGKKTETTSFFRPTVVEQKVLVIRFTRGGIVEDVRWLDKDDAREVAMVGRVTPTRGKELGIIEQIIGNVGKFSSSGPPRPTPDN